ncbi:MAG: ParB/RepB/Spo0J family partition protein [Planctomycetes bacterium]|nr:ParB/RepB/Spo0J family partition protein [Planctomycetota bacterium]
MVQRKLGRGLDFLISGSEEAAQNEVLALDLAVVQPNPFQPRRDFAPAELAELAASIREHGVVQPIIVRRTGDTYQIVAGERRFRASQQLGLTTIPAIVRAADDTAMLELALIENIQRSDLNAIELAHAYQGYLNRLGLTQEQAAERLGKSRSAVANTIRLLDLPEDVQELVSRGTLTMGHARALLAVDGAERQRAFAARIASEGWNVRDIERAVKEPVREPAESSSEAAAPATAATNHMADLEAQLREALGTKVHVRDRGGPGKIVIEYYSRQECDRLLEILTSSRGTS